MRQAIIAVEVLEGYEGYCELKIKNGFGDAVVKFAPGTVRFPEYTTSATAPAAPNPGPLFFRLSIAAARYIAAAGFYFSYPVEALCYKDYDAFVRHRRQVWDLIWRNS